MPKIGLYLIRRRENPHYISFNYMRPSCTFHEAWWNDSEQRNYDLHECKNPENTGGKASMFTDIEFSEPFHNERTYSHMHPNQGMKYRCWGQPEKMAKCPLVKYKRR